MQEKIGDCCARPCRNSMAYWRGISSFVTNRLLKKETTQANLNERSVSDHRAGTSDHPFLKHLQDRLRVQYARHGRDLVGWKSPVLSFGFFF